MTSVNEITDVNEIESVLREARVCRIALFDGEYPYILPALFGYSLSGEKAEIYFRCGEKDDIVEIIKKDNRASFEVDRNFSIVPEENPFLFEASYESVTGAGVVEIITGIDKITGFSHIARKYNTDGSEINISEQLMNSIAVLKLTAATICCRKY